MTIDPREFRNALGCFATGITVITTLDEATEETNGTAALAMTYLEPSRGSVLVARAKAKVCCITVRLRAACAGL